VRIDRKRGFAKLQHSGDHGFRQSLGNRSPRGRLEPGCGLVYARRPRTSPPLVVRAISAADLRHAIEAAEAERGLR
jgi:hypothetical protein